MPTFVRGRRLARAGRQARRWAGRVVAPGRRGVERARAFGPQAGRVGLRISALAVRPTQARRQATVDQASAALAQVAGLDRTVSMVVVGDGCAPEARASLVGAAEVIVVGQNRAGSGVGADRFVAWPAGASVVEAAAAGAAVAQGDLLCWILPTTIPLSSGWLARLASGIGGDVVAAAPLLVHPARPFTQATPHDLRTRSLGLSLDLVEGNVPAVGARLAGAVPDLTGRPVRVFASGGVGLLVDRIAYQAAGGLGPVNDFDAAAVDLCWRLRKKGGLVVAVPGAALYDGRPVASRQQLTRPIDPVGSGWRAVVDRWGPALRHEARRLGLAPSDDGGNGLQIVVTVASPSIKVAPKWGDWHLAQDLARALGRRGFDARVSTADQADSLAVRCADIHLVVRGIAPIRRSPGQHHVLWIISHPDGITDGECDAADLVLVASKPFADALAQRTTTPVEVLLQATDPARFHSTRVDPERTRPIVVVAKTRDVLRPVVADAVAVGLVPAIYGSGWEAFGLGHLVKADHLPNEELPAVYASAGVVLNDHWADMATWGFLSNRLFDVLACGTPVISDAVPEIAEVFGDTVQTYENPDDLKRLVDAIANDPESASGRASRGREIVLAAHTFDHRARELAAALTRAGLDGRPQR